MAAHPSLRGPAEPSEWRAYDVIVGTGGIGSGIFMRLEGNALLGREESRPVTLIDARDYCKLHIVFHYLQVLIGEQVRLIPVGKVGDDAAGLQLIDEMRMTGLDLDYVTTVPDQDTLYSVSFSYPNGDGGNLTTSQSASNEVTPEDIRAAEPELSRAFGRGIVLALPEVPLEAQIALLRMGGEQGSLRVAAFLSSEAATVSSLGLLEDVDLLVLNADEATAFTGVEAGSAEGFAQLSIDRLLAQNERLWIVITAGIRGSWSWDGETTAHVPAIPAHVRSTAGAGDSHLAGILCGIARGVGLHEANRFASLISSMKVASPHSINRDIDWASVKKTAAVIGFSLPAGIERAQDGDQWKAADLR